MGGGVGANLRRGGEEALQRHSGGRPAARGPASSSGVAGGAEPARQLRHRGAHPAASAWAAWAWREAGRSGGRPAWPAAAAAPGTSGGGERDLRLRKAARGGELLCVLRVCVA